MNIMYIIITDSYRLKRLSQRDRLMSRWSLRSLAVTLCLLISGVSQRSKWMLENPKFNLIA